MTDQIEVLRHNARIYFYSRNMLAGILKSRAVLQGNSLDEVLKTMQFTYTRRIEATQVILQPYFLSDQELNELLNPLKITRS